jgi:hypothetical protein
MSLDGYVAGPGQSAEEPLGRGARSDLAERRDEAVEALAGRIGWDD